MSFVQNKEAATERQNDLDKIYVYQDANLNGVHVKILYVAPRTYMLITVYAYAENHIYRT